ncbi:DNA polymerase III subunit gamma and tau [Natronoglycomyces albus]|uniref:DNA polymerase III subunit gamma/tau n=1 Tax=Natronoglycomyces albus TaxID=2811108 RepID=A0A895XZT3_9ACTN|nr:DNA polymerase III subunit gamma and tau [Natronoglycomyces albus]
MALALYRKYRPQTFADVVGQEHVTAPLIQAIRNERLNHAYLFSGPRGCGKTSSARILARSLNCAQGPTPEPCGECGPCEALSATGHGSVDVIEIDAASHGGVDDARELRERAVFAPVESRFKIYIIDEAHMVSSAGFNALLKLVEEPPEYVKFIFATTEPEKVLPTIRSRTHHYPFRLVPPQPMRQLCEKLCDKEGVTVAAEVFPLVVRAGDGSIRDTLSVLDQLIAGSGDEGVTYEQAVGLLGVTDANLLDEMCESFAAADGAGVLTTIDRVIEAGHDPRRFTADLLERLRDLVILNQVPDAGTSGLIDVPAEQLSKMTSQATRMGTSTLTRMAEVIGTGLDKMRGATAPRLLLEVACVRAILPGSEESLPGLLQRLDRLESGAVSFASPAASSPAPTPTPAVKPTSAPAAATEQPKAQPAAASVPPAATPPVATAPSSPSESPASAAPSPAAASAPAPAVSGQSEGMDAAGIRRSWDRIMQAVKGRKRSVAALLVEGTVIDAAPGRVTLAFKHAFHATAIQQKGAMKVVEDALAEVLGGNWKIECDVAEAAAARKRPAPTSNPAPPAPAQPTGPPAAPTHTSPPPAEADYDPWEGTSAAPPGAPQAQGSPSGGDVPPPEDEPSPADAYLPGKVGTSHDQAVQMLRNAFGARPM